eukprot:619982_1
MATVVDSLPQMDRKEFLVHGFVRQTERKLQKRMPNPIKDFIAETLLSAMIVESDEELRLQKELSKQQPSTFKVIMSGDQGVGKSAMTIRMVADEYMDDYDPTIEDCYTCTINVSGRNVDLDILDTAGMEMYYPWQMHHVRTPWPNGWMLIYDVTSVESLDDLRNYHQKISTQSQYDRDECVLLLVGNKCDVKDSDRQVPYELGAQTAREWNVLFIETSAKQGTNIYEAFEMLIIESRKRNLSVVAPPAYVPGPVCCIML